jgi:hypothetical protein
MDMETYLAKMFNHGSTLVDVFSWGIGGDANRSNDFRQVTESAEALGAYRKFLGGGRLTEDKSETPTLLERLPAKIHRVQDELPAWVQRSGRQAEALPLMTELRSALEAKDFERAEKAADAILKMIGDANPSGGQDVTEESSRRLRHQFGFFFLVFRHKIQAELGVSPEQSAALQRYLRDTAAAEIVFIEASKSRGIDFEAHRTKAQENLELALKGILSDSQLKRLGELVRQREGLFGGPSLWTGLDITDKERSQFMALIKPMRTKMEAIAAEAQRRTDPSDVQRQVLGLRAELERQLEAVLTDSQRGRWKKMLGQPVGVDALFDLSTE